MSGVADSGDPVKPKPFLSPPHPIFYLYIRTFVLYLDSPPNLSATLKCCYFLPSPGGRGAGGEGYYSKGLHLNEIVPASSADSLVQFERLRQEIEAARSIPDVKDLRDKAEAIRHYLQQADESLTVLNAVAELKIRAERRAGQILLEMNKNQGGKPVANVSHDARGYDSAENAPLRITELGITHSQSSRWQQIAALPDPTFETYLEDVQNAGRELTSSGL